MKDETRKTDSDRVEDYTECHAGEFGLCEEGAREPWNYITYGTAIATPDPHKGLYSVGFLSLFLAVCERISS